MCHGTFQQTSTSVILILCIKTLSLYWNLMAPFFTVCVTKGLTDWGTVNFGSSLHWWADPDRLSGCTLEEPKLTSSETQEQRLAKSRGSVLPFLWLQDLIPNQPLQHRQLEGSAWPLDPINLNPWPKQTEPRPWKQPGSIYFFREHVT